MGKKSQKAIRSARSLQTGSFDTWVSFTAQAGLLALFEPLVAMRVGAAIHNVEMALEKGLRDRSTGL